MRLLVFILIFSWIFSGWPQIWQNPSIPPRIQEAQAITCGFGTDIGGGVCRGYLTTTGAGTWTVPNDWNSSSNSIETIGAGGGGCGHNATNGNGGGGGGAYSKIINLTLTPSASVNVTVGAAGAFRGNGGATWFNSTTCSGSSVCADGGVGALSATGALGGTVANGKVTGAGSVQYKGGTGGDGNGTADSQGGGGGAGGPNGDGGAGGFGDNDNTTDGVGGGGGGNGGRTTTGGYVGGDGRVSDTVGANGGNNFNNDAGSGGTGGSPGAAGTNGGGGGGGSDAQAGGNGGAGIDWDATHGSGGGGGGSGDLQAGTTGGKGGLYGGGSGGGDNSGGQGVGAQGIIVITYTPVPAAPTNVAATDGTYTDKVTITWTKSTGATNYHVWRDAVDLGAAGDVATFDDTGAGAPTVTAGTASATDGSATDKVTLSISGASANNGTTHTYKVVASNTAGNSVDSVTNTGYRGVGSLTYQWNRSSGDADSGYSTLSGATTAPYDDTTASAPTVTAGTASATDGSATDKVTLSISGASANNGAGKYYYATVSATGASSADTTHDRGYRGVGSLTYQWSRSSGTGDSGYSTLSGATTAPYDDTTAPAPTITAGTADASDGTSAAHVALSVSGQSANIGAVRYYYATVSATGASSQDTNHNDGYIGVGSLTYQWQRSAADSDASYSNIDGATTASYNDTGAPADGSGRYFKVVENATGATQQISSSDRGYRMTGSLSTDIVNASYVSVGSPTMAMSAATFSLTCQTKTSSFGTASQQIYVNNNNGANNGWTLTVAAQAITNVWDSAGTDYDFNDPTGSGCTDGADAGDSVGGQMTIDPSVATLAIGQCGSCSTANVSKGSSAAFNEGTTDAITLLTATAASDDVGDWILQGVSISQKIPAEQPAASDYDINMVLTVTAN